ncbi:AI-2E family transporter [Candidatus Peregrinibacteria bacterium]|jgi:predicted PurR-regulated permease PerM|nr:AI-2E family transporter [Candidatus Peregrinibacteria bacterium]MBT7736936.1 AI-2E family transporter [Candidatus Peregrinibacteria bacterium]
MPTSTKKPDIVQNIQKYFILAIVVLLIVTIFKFMEPLLGTLFMAIVIVTGAHPLTKLLKSKLRLPSSLTAFLVMLLIIVVVVIPLTFFMFAMVGQAADAYATISATINEMINSDKEFLSFLEKYPTIHGWFEQVVAYNPVSTQDLVSAVGDFVGKISSFLLENTTNLLKNLTVIVLNIVVFLIALFYLIRDGEKLVDYANGLLPLSKKYRKELIVKLYNLMHAIIFGIFGAALAQGLFVGVGLAIVGVENAVFWGAIAALLSPVPYVGVALVWVPFAIGLFVSQSWGMGLFFVLWCLLLVTNIDNIIKPYLIGSKSHLHPFAVLVVMLGGALAFGVRGLLFGPFILTITLAFLHIYKLEYKKALSSPFEMRVASKPSLFSFLRKKRK